MLIVQDYITTARILLKDTVENAHRYSDESLKLALHMAFIEAYRIRPDMFVNKAVPDMKDAAVSAEVPAPMGYQMAFVYYMCGWTQLQDEEETTDSRAISFINKFTAQLLNVAA